MMAMGVWEGMEVAVEGKGPGPVYGAIPLNRFYRVVFRAIIGSLPALATMTIFFFPALVSLEVAIDQMNGSGSCAPKNAADSRLLRDAVTLQPQLNFNSQTATSGLTRLIAIPHSRQMSASLQCYKPYLLHCASEDASQKTLIE